MYYNLLSKIKNAQHARKESFVTPFSKGDFAIANLLKDKGYLKSVAKKELGKKNVIEIKLSYKENVPAITDFKIISKPSRRFYIGYRELLPVKQGHGLAILSTPKGILANKEARKEKLGGEYLFQIW